MRIEPSLMSLYGYRLNPTKDTEALLVPACNRLRAHIVELGLAVG